MGLGRLRRLGRGKFLSLFQPLVAGKVLKTSERVFIPTKIDGFFKVLNAAVNTFWKKTKIKISTSFGHILPNCKRTRIIGFLNI